MRWVVSGLWVLLAANSIAATGAPAPAASMEGRSPFAAASAVQGPTWMPVPRITGRLRAADIGLVINIADPVSVQVGEHYIAARRLAPTQVLRLSLPVQAVLGRDDFDGLARTIASHFGPRTQALALAWTAPYAVECNSITGALALGFDAEVCKQGCAITRASRYFNSAVQRPLAELGWRPAMLLAGRTVEQAKAMIDRGVASDGSLARRGRPPVSVMLLNTDDAPRRVRMAVYPPAGLLRSVGVEVKVVPPEALAQARHVLMVSTGSVRAPVEPAPDWVPGGLGDHLTSYGGDLLDGRGQGTALDWLASGATASYGTVSEPCNHLQKFPHPQVLMGHYVQGATAIEAYWKSVAWPQQGLFVGEPLAAPFAPVSARP